MKSDPKLRSYIDRNKHALQDNNPRTWPRYQDDPVGCWRWIAHLIGYGFAEFEDKAVQDTIGSLYGSIVVIAEIGSPKGITINAKQFNAWLTEAWQQGKNDRALAGIHQKG